MPKGAREFLPKFSEDGRVSRNDHLNYFNNTCGVIDVGIKDVAILLFVQTLTEAVADWFHHLSNGSIKTWNAMKTTFEACFKATNDEHSLLLQLS